MRSLPIILAALALLFPSSSARAQCTESTLLTVSHTDNVLRELSLPDLALVAEYPIPAPLAGTMIERITGVAVDPANPDRIALLMRQAGAPVDIPFLIFYDIDSGLVDLAGPTAVDFICLAFDDAGVVHTVSKDTASPPNAFCTLNQMTGAPTDICMLSEGNTTQGLAYRTVDGAFYHASGATDVIFEEVTGTGTSPCGTTSIVIGAPLTDDLVAGLCYDSLSDRFLWKQGGIGGPVFSVSPAGSPVLLGTLDHDASDLAIRHVPVPCPVDLYSRGDLNGDASIDVSDAVFGLASLFIPGSPSVACRDAGDVNDDGALDVSDMVYLLASLFVPGSPSPPPPYPACDVDPTADSLDCLDYGPC